jgi:isoleucyl-tRNA synthetase
MAPFTPFISEEIYRNLTSCHAELVSASSSDNEIPKPARRRGRQDRDGKNCSVHLEDFPTADEKLIDENLNEEMANVREIISEGLQLRARAGIKVRQPLQEVRIKNNKVREEMQNIIKEELNIKVIVFDEKQEEKIKLDTNISEELKLEGQAREIIRFVQEMRKEAGYEVDNRIEIGYSVKSLVLEKFKELIARETLAEDISLISDDFTPDLKKTFEVGGEELEIGIRKI